MDAGVGHRKSQKATMLRTRFGMVIRGSSGRPGLSAKHVTVFMKSCTKLAISSEPHTAKSVAAHGPFGVQALACPAQCSLKAELRTCAHRILFLRMLLFGDSTKFLVFLDRLDFALLSTASKIVRGRSSD